MVEREVLQGGVGNAGLVVREGDRVSRPGTPQSETIQSMLRHVRAAGFDGVPEPLGVDRHGREWLSYVAGDVPCPPYPEWAVTDEALTSIAVLLRRFHEATVGFERRGDQTWDLEMARAEGGEVICHHDVCLENVVFRDGVAVALLDLDFAAPGTRVWDVACFARMCVPIDSPEDAVRMRRPVGDPFRRLRLVADAYGLPPDRTELVELLGMQTSAGGWFVKRRVDAGDEAFTRMWKETGGAERYDRRRDWFEAHRRHFLDELRP